MKTRACQPDLLSTGSSPWIRFWTCMNQGFTNCPIHYHLRLFKSLIMFSLNRVNYLVFFLSLIVTGPVANSTSDVWILGLSLSTLNVWFPFPFFWIWLWTLGCDLASGLSLDAPKKVFSSTKKKNVLIHLLHSRDVWLYYWHDNANFTSKRQENHPIHI